MNVDSINNGYVLDHITAGRAMSLYQHLGLDKLTCSVAVIMNVKSNKMGQKDIIKIDGELDINLDSIGYIDPNVTVNVIVDGKLVEKHKQPLPEKIEGLVHCKNPRCISVTEKVPHVFKLTDPEKGVYRCIYCETRAK